jgi:hypothetical protein
MLTTLRVAAKVVGAPLYVLWKAYGVLWWAFDDTSERRAGVSASIAPPGTPPVPPADPAVPSANAQAHAQTAAFEIIDSTPAPTPPPTSALRGGFVGTLVMSLVAAVTSGRLVSEHSISGSTGWLLWGWVTAVTAVGSVYFVRHIARRHAAQRPATRLERAKATLGGMKDACVSAGAGVASGCRHAAAAARATGRGCRSAWNFAPVAFARRSLGHAAAKLASLRRRTPQTAA